MFVGTIPADELGDPAVLIIPLLTDKLPAIDVVLLIHIVNKIPADKRKDVVALAAPFVTDKMTGKDIALRLLIAQKELGHGMHKRESVVAVEEFMSDQPTSGVDLEDFREGANLSNSGLRPTGEGDIQALTDELVSRL